MAFPWKNLPDLPDFPDYSLPDYRLPDLSALGSLAGQLQAVVSGAIAHPFWAIALILLSITLIQIVADLIKRSLKALLTLLLKLPLFVSQWIWKRTVSPAKTPTDAQLLSKADQVDQLITQLETLRQQQDLIITELKSVLNQPAPPPDSEPANPALPAPQTEEPLSEAQTPSP